MLTVKRLFTDNEHYKEVLGPIEDIYVRAMQWLYSDEAYESELDYQIPDDIPLYEYFNCVMEFEKLSFSDYADASLKESVAKLKANTAIIPIKANRINNISENGKEYSTFDEMNSLFAEDVLWGAFILQSIRWEISSGEEKTKYEKSKNVLWSVLIEDSGIAEEYFIQNHLLGKKTDEMIKNILIGIQKSKEKNPEFWLDKKEVNESRLAEIISIPLMFQCYEAMSEVLGGITAGSGVCFEADTYLRIFDAATDYVNLVETVKFKDIKIKNIKGEIKQKYKDEKLKLRDGHHFDSYFGTLIELTFLVILSDKYKDTNPLVTRALQDYKVYIRHCSDPHEYTKNDMWQILNEAITSTYEKIDINALREEITEKTRIIEEQKEEIELLKGGWIKEENGEIKTSKTKKKILLLKYLTGMPDMLSGEQREHFKALCKFMTGAEDGTIDNNLKPNALMDETTLNELIEKYHLR